MSSQYNTIFIPSKAFGTGWLSHDAYTSGVPDPAKSVAETRVNGTNVLGEWASLLLPSPIVLTSYTFQPQTNMTGWLVVGSMDGVNWSTVDTAGGVSVTSGTTLQLPCD